MKPNNYSYLLSLLFAGFVAFLPVGCSQEQDETSLSQHYQNASTYEFVNDYISALGFVKEAKQRSENIPDGSDYEVGVKLLSGVRYSIQDFSKARQQIEGYSQSKNELIAQATSGAITAFAELQRVANETLRLLENLYSNESAQTVNEGKYAVAQAKLTSEATAAYELLMYASIGVIHSLVDRTPDEKGNLSSLNITALEKAKLTRHMQDTFGNIQGFEAGMDYSNAPVSLLYHWLTTAQQSPKQSLGS